MQKFILFILSALSLLGCDQNIQTEQTDVFIQRTNDYAIYCSEDYMSDVTSFKIEFRDERVFIEETTLFLDEPYTISENEMLQVSSLNSGLPFGQYQVVSEEGTKILIEIVGVKPTTSDLEDVVFFFGSTLKDGSENLITCVGDLP